MFNRMLVVAGMTAAFAVPEIAAAQASAPAAPAANAAHCDPYKDYSCFDSSLGTGIWERLVNYYELEWNQPGAPVDPHAPPGRREGWPATPMTTPPMPFTEWPYGGTESLGVTTPNSIDSPLMVAIADTDLGKWMSDKHLQFYGWVNGGGNLSTSKVRPGGNWPAAYAYTPNTLTLDQVVLYLDRFPDVVQSDHVDWGMRLSAIYGENYRYTTAYGIDTGQLVTQNKVNGYDFPMEWLELFVPQAAEGLMLRLGRFISVPDIEAQLAPNNYMYSHSMTYAYDNYTNEGLEATLAVTPKFTLMAGITVGTEASFAHLNKSIPNPYQYINLSSQGIVGPLAGGAMQNPLYPSPTMKQDPGSMPSFTLCGRYTTQSGDDDVNVCADAINKGTWGYNNLQWFGATYYHKFDDHWHVSWEGYHLYINGVPNLNSPVVAAMNQVYGTDGGTPFSPAQGFNFNNPNEAQCNGTVLTCRAEDYATVAYFNYSPDPLNNFSIRPEWFWDTNGQRTGTRTRYSNLGFGWQHWFGPQFEVRPEVVYYHSWNGPAFNGNSNAGILPDKSSEIIVSGDIIWHF